MINLVHTTGRQVLQHLIERQGGVCEFCSQPIDLVNAIKHHFKPKSKRGPDDEANLRARHQDCESYCHRHFLDGNCPPESRVVAVRQMTLGHSPGGKPATPALSWRDLTNLKGEHLVKAVDALSDQQWKSMPQRVYRQVRRRVRQSNRDMETPSRVSGIGMRALMVVEAVLHRILV